MRKRKTLFGAGSHCQMCHLQMFLLWRRTGPLTYPCVDKNKMFLSAHKGLWKLNSHCISGIVLWLCRRCWVSWQHCAENQKFTNWWFQGYCWGWTALTRCVTRLQLLNCRLLMVRAIRREKRQLYTNAQYIKNIFALNYSKRRGKEGGKEEPARLRFARIRTRLLNNVLNL